MEVAVFVFAELPFTMAVDRQLGPSRAGVSNSALGGTSRSDTDETREATEESDAVAGTGVELRLWVRLCRRRSQFRRNTLPHAVQL